MRNEFVPLILPKQFFEIIKKDKTFLIRYAGEGVVRIFPFEIDYKFCELVRLSILPNGIGKRFPTDDGRKITMWFAMSECC